MKAHDFQNKKNGINWSVTSGFLVPGIDYISLGTKRDRGGVATYFSMSNNLMPFNLL